VWVWRVVDKFSDALGAVLPDFAVLFAAVAVYERSFSQTSGKCAGAAGAHRGPVKAMPEGHAGFLGADRMGAGLLTDGAVRGAIAVYYTTVAIQGTFLAG